MHVSESFPATKEFSTMVLLVDDQAIVAHAVRRLLADLPDIDLHYCSDPAQAIEDATRSSHP
jgi:two-component system chemotaxis family response regulator WspR